MEGLEIVEVTFESDLYKKVYVLRDVVLRKPIGLSLDDEDLSEEVNDYILAIVNKDKVVGCLILTPISNTAVQLRQMAICDSWQRKGLGKFLVDSAEKLTIKKGYTDIVLHARIVARSFYQKLGYLVTGDIFTEVGIDHIKMQKKIIEAL